MRGFYCGGAAPLEWVQLFFQPENKLLLCALARREDRLRASGHIQAAVTTVFRLKK